MQTACWSPSGSHLLFATKGEPTLFALDLSPSSADSGSSPSAAVPVADLSAVAYDSGDGEEIMYESCNTITSTSILLTFFKMEI